ncbi:pilus assembly protein PilM [uncultured Microbacterium sp.]|uniref:type IV pilus biogenesis protein PilM n=1 Tax=uncultured Microbacterium sp. TaxID=191216 RepID=UPI0028D65DAA|nr:pilus assembly protein PilM [uncultured Microbacterium sp.]
MAKTIVGLEVTEESVRAAEVSLGRKPQLVAYGEVPLPPESAKDSEVIDQGAVAVALRQLWTGARFKSKDVVLGLASRRILVREYTTQVMRADLLRDALPYQVQDLLPVPASQAVLDFYPLAEHDGQVSGLLVAAVAENVEQIIATLSRVKLRARAVDLAAFGLGRVTAPLANADETVASVNIGDHTTQVVVSRGGIPQFVRLLPVDVPTTATQRHAVADEFAQAPSLEYASAASTRPRGAMRSSASPGVSDLAARLRSTLAFFASRPNATALSQVFVTGAGIAIEGMLPALAAAVDTPLRVVNVEDVIGMSAASPGGEFGLNLVGTVGIATGGGR